MLPGAEWCDVYGLDSRKGGTDFGKRGYYAVVAGEEDSFELSFIGVRGITDVML